MVKRKQKAVAAPVVASAGREFDDIESDLNSVKCTLTCACFALGHAQDTADFDLGAKAWKAVYSCVAALDRLEDDLNDWGFRHDPSLKEVSRG
jgi:hypothetical protein